MKSPGKALCSCRTCSGGGHVIKNHVSKVTRLYVLKWMVRDTVDIRNRDMSARNALDVTQHSLADGSGVQENVLPESGCREFADARGFPAIKLVEEGQCQNTRLANSKLELWQKKHAFLMNSW